ncbi:MAG: carbonic anhydrase [Magnetococcales bacterium]|nr:carbonic anhydrase [Magnetococcales bacterium]NGZ04814.1 carbonic anhydrase [Magnetococcales bacterium]
MPYRNIINRLIAGFKGFHAYYYEQRGELFESLVKDGQRPPIMLIGCSDSRVDPAIMLHFEPGDVFTVRNVANLVPPYELGGAHSGVSAALEFAVRDLVVSHIVVLGHSQCGGIHELIRLAHHPVDDREFLGFWVSIGKEAVEHLQAEFGDHKPIPPAQIEQATIALSISNLMTYPWIAERVRRERLLLHGWWADLENGELWGLNHTIKKFEKLC